MKPKKINRILSQFEHFLKGQNSFGIGLNENQRKDFIEYAKRVLDKKNKKEKPTFTQPKEVGEKAISYKFTEKGFSNYSPKFCNNLIIEKHINKDGFGIEIFYREDNSAFVFLSINNENISTTWFKIEKCFNLEYIATKDSILDSSKWTQAENIIFIH